MASAPSVVSRAKSQFGDVSTSERDYSERNLDKISFKTYGVPKSLHTLAKQGNFLGTVWWDNFSRNGSLRFGSPADNHVESFEHSSPFFSHEFLPSTRVASRATFLHARPRAFSFRHSSRHFASAFSSKFPLQRRRFVAPLKSGPVSRP